MDERSVRGFQKSAKADVLFRVLLVKQHSKIGICFAPAIDEEIYLIAISFEVATYPTLKGRRREEVCSEATSFEVATYPTLKGRRREEVYSEATSFEVATYHRLTTMTRVKIHWRFNSSSHNCNVSLRA